VFRYLVRCVTREKTENIEQKSNNNAKGAILQQKLRGDTEMMGRLGQYEAPVFGELGSMRWPRYWPGIAGEHLSNK